MLVMFWHWSSEILLVCSVPGLWVVALWLGICLPLPSSSGTHCRSATDLPPSRTMSLEWLTMKRAEVVIKTSCFCWMDEPPTTNIPRCICLDYSRLANSTWLEWTWINSLIYWKTLNRLAFTFFVANRLFFPSFFNKNTDRAVFLLKTITRNTPLFN